MKEKLMKIETNLQVAQKNLRRHKWSKSMTKGDEEFVSLFSSDLDDVISEIAELRNHFKKVSELLDK